jgi:hypothetical protein
MKTKKIKPPKITTSTPQGKTANQIAIMKTLPSARVMLDEYEDQLCQWQAKRKLEADNKAFDHFVNTGEVIPVEEPSFMDHFQSLSRAHRVGQPKPQIVYLSATTLPPKKSKKI